MPTSTQDGASKKSRKRIIVRLSIAESDENFSELEALSTNKARNARILDLKAGGNKLERFAKMCIAGELHGIVPMQFVAQAPAASVLATPSEPVTFAVKALESKVQPAPDVVQVAGITSDAPPGVTGEEDDVPRLDLGGLEDFS